MVEEEGVLERGEIARVVATSRGTLGGLNQGSQRREMKQQSQQ